MPLQSPRTLQFAAPPPDEEAAFENSFTEKAQQAFFRKFPELIQNVVHFKTIEIDVTKKQAVGAVVVRLQGEIILFPIIFNNGLIKPVVLFYVPAFKRFFPATKEWLEEITQRSTVNMGNAVEIPKTLEPDQDIRSLVVPPTVGRYAYAAAQPRLVEFLTRASNLVKKAFATLLKKNKRIMKFAFATYDKQALLESLRPTLEKAAAVPSYAVSILTPDASADEFKREYGDNAMEAWQLATELGYVLKDTRSNTNTYLKIEKPLYMTAVTSTGFYKIFVNGEAKEALVIPSPRDKFTRKSSRSGIQPLPDPYVLSKKAMLSPVDWNCLVYTEDGDIYVLSSAKPLGEVLHYTSETSNIVQKIKKNLKSFPAIGDTGFFVNFLPQGIHVSDVFTIKRSVVNKKARLFFGQSYSSNRNIITPLQGGPKEIRQLSDGTLLVPATYQFLSGNLIDNKDAVLIMGFLKLSKLNNLQQGLAAYLPHAKLLYNNGVFGLAGTDKQFTKVGCIAYLANTFGLFAPDAAELVEQTEKCGSCFFYIVPQKELNKVANFVKAAQGAIIQGRMPGLSDASAMPPTMFPEGGPPGMMPPGMMPPGMMPPGTAPQMPVSELPPVPNPLELAAQEIEQQLLDEAQQTNEELLRKRDELERQLQVVDAMKRRAQEIATGQPATPEEAAAAAEPLVEDAADLADQELFEATAIGTLAGLQKPFELVQEYLPSIEQAVDTLARILLTFWLKENDIKKDIGDMRYDEFEQKCISLLQNVGSLLLQLNKLLALSQ